MKKRQGLEKMRKAIYLIIILLNVFLTESCPSDCPNYEYKSNLDHSEFLKRLPDERRINEIALSGSHLSAVDNNQDLTIADQLKFGVRVLDISVRAIFNTFALHYHDSFLNYMFSEILCDIDKFLKNNPQEFVILLLKQGYTPASDVTKSNCEILSDYDYKKRFIKNWSLNDTIGMHRGRLLLATIKDQSLSECIVTLNTQCKLSSDFNLRNVYRTGLMAHKYFEINQLQKFSLENNHYRCFINILGVDYRNSFAPRQLALEGFDAVKMKCHKPINYFMANRFLKPRSGLIIVLADFPTQELIDRVNYSN